MTNGSEVMAGVLEAVNEALTVVSKGTVAVAKEAMARVEHDTFEMCARLLERLPADSSPVECAVVIRELARRIAQDRAKEKS